MLVPYSFILLMLKMYLLVQRCLPIILPVMKRGQHTVLLGTLRP